MKKTSILSVLLAVLTLTSCGAAESYDANSMKSDSQESSQIVNMNLRSVEEEAAVTEEGCYTIDLIPNPDDSGNIMYIDFQSKSGIHLCSSANCTHDGPECDGRVEPSGGGSCPIIIGNQFVLVFPGAPHYNDELGEASFPKIMTLGPDGKDKTVITRFGAAQQLRMPYIVDDDGKNLYCTLDTTEAEQFKREIIKIDITTGKWNSIYEMDTEHDEQLVDAFDSSFLLSSLAESFEDTLSSGMVTTVFHRLDLSTGEKETVFSPKSGDTLRVFQGEQIYYFSVSENSLHSLNCATLEDRVLKENVFDSNVDLKNNVEFLDCRDGHALLGLFTTDSTGSEEFSLYQVDLSTGEKSEFSLIKTSDLGKTMPVQVLAKIPGTNQYLVDMGDEAVEMETRQDDGTSMYVTTSRIIYGIIDVEDYWASNPEYSVIKFSY